MRSVPETGSLEDVEHWLLSSYLGLLSCRLYVESCSKIELEEDLKFRITYWQLRTEDRPPVTNKKHYMAYLRYEKMRCGFEYRTRYIKLETLGDDWM
jgi:hypothetical protein